MGAVSGRKALEAVGGNMVRGRMGNGTLLVLRWTY